MKAQYIIVNSEDKYFVKILENNSILFTDKRNEATKMDWNDSQDLIPIIESKGHICMAESV